MATAAKETDRNDPIEDAPSPSGKVRISQKTFDWFFGYDCFIVHGSVDGKDLVRFG
jgi:hypothetical protein